MKSKFALFWFVVSLALGAVLFLQTRRAETEKARTEALQMQVENLSEQVRASQAQVKLLKDEKQALMASASFEKPPLEPVEHAKAPTASAPPEQAGQTAGQAGAGAPGRMGALLGDMMKDPEMRKALAQQQRVGLNMAYGALFKQLQLTPEQEEKFKDILMEQQMSNMSQAGALMQPGEDKAELGKKLAEEQKAREAQMRELLGDDKFAQYQDYNQTVGERILLEQFGKQIETTPDQQEQLLAIMREEKQNAQINMGGTMVKPDNMQAVLGSPETLDKMMSQQEQVNARVLERAGNVLTPEQVRKLGPVLQTQLEMQRAGMKMAREMFGGGAPSAEPPAK